MRLLLAYLVLLTAFAAHAQSPEQLPDHPSPQGSTRKRVANATPAQPQDSSLPGTDLALLNEINQIKAIDNHAHPPALNGQHGEKDEDFDALPCDPLEPTDAGMFFREDNPVYIKAWKAMFSYKYDDF